jgi:uncharacterized protein (TIGR02996 family)
MSTGEALLAAIRSAPDDDVPRLVYADWLDEHDDPDRAEFIRVQIAMNRLDRPEPDWMRLAARSTQLLTANIGRWAEPYRPITRSEATGIHPTWVDFDPDRAQQLTFERGFVEAIWTDYASPLDWPSDLLGRFAPIPRVVLDNSNGVGRLPVGRSGNSCDPAFLIPSLVSSCGE